MVELLGYTKPLPLSPDEVRTLDRTMRLLVVRPVRRQPRRDTTAWALVDAPSNRRLVGRQWVPVRDEALGSVPDSDAPGPTARPPALRAALRCPLGAPGQRFCIFEPSPWGGRGLWVGAVYVLDVRVVRLHALTGEEAVAAGAGVPDTQDPRIPGPPADATAVPLFRAQWDARHEKHPWDTNPWCWAARVKLDF